MQDQTDLYEILQVHPSAEQEVIDVAFRRLARMYHPDVNKSPDANERMKALNLAYEILGDPAKRADYDRQRGNRAEYNRQRASREQSEWQARDEYAERERQARADAERQRAGREYQRWEKEEPSDTEYNLPLGLAVINGIGMGVMCSIISTAVFFLLDLIGWTTAAAWFIGGMIIAFSGVSLWTAIAAPFGGGVGEVRPPHPRMLIRFVRAFLNISFVLISFYVTWLLWVQFAEVSSILVVGISSFILVTASYLVYRLYERDDE